MRRRRRIGGAFLPRRFFIAGAQGAWYDPSDYQSLYQESSGSTSVTAVEQSIGLVLDKSQGTLSGNELVSNGTFSSGVTTGWSSTGSAVLSVSSGRMRVTNGATITGGTTQTINTVAGRAYRFSYYFNIGTSSSVIVRARDATTLTVLQTISQTTTNSYSYIFYATGSTTQIQAINGSNTSGLYFEVDEITVFEIPGNHCLQATSGSRPILRSGNLCDFDGSNDSISCSTAGSGTSGFFLCTAIEFDGVSSTQTIFSDTGTNTGYRVVVNSSNTVEFSAGNGTAFTTATTSGTIASGSKYLITAWHDGVNLNVQLDDGVTASAAFATATAGTAGFTIGKTNGASSNYLNGKIAQLVYIKNAALSSNQISDCKRYIKFKSGL